jgi:hypothetical protein
MPNAIRSMFMVCSTIAGGRKMSSYSITDYLWSTHCVRVREKCRRPIVPGRRVTDPHHKLGRLLCFLSPAFAKPAHDDFCFCE